MEKREFGKVLEQSRLARGVSRPQLAERMASESDAAPKGIEGMLWRYEQTGEKARKPREPQIYKIVDALSSIANDSEAEKDLLLRDLMSAADLSVTDEDQVEYLRRQCEMALKGVGYLKDHQIQTILDHVSDSTMKRIAKAAKDGEPIEFVHLNALSEELQTTAARYGGEESGKDAPAHIIPAGRARIVIDGEVDAKQKRLLKDIAKMIETALEA